MIFSEVSLPSIETIGQGGAVAFVLWLMYYMTTKILPDSLASVLAVIAEERKSHRADLQEDRTVFRESLAAERTQCAIFNTAQMEAFADLRDENRALHKETRQAVESFRRTSFDHTRD